MIAGNISGGTLRRFMRAEKPPLGNSHEFPQSKNAALILFRADSLFRKMASLQEQLKKIGTADLRNTTEASRKHKASILFTSREAADYDLETIFALGHNGIAELITIDKSFAPFEKTLFSESMKSVDRVLQVCFAYTSILCS